MFFVNAIMQEISGIPDPITSKHLNYQKKCSFRTPFHLYRKAHRLGCMGKKHGKCCHHRHGRNAFPTGSDGEDLEAEVVLGYFFSRQVFGRPLILVFFRCNSLKS